MTKAQRVLLVATAAVALVFDAGALFGQAIPLDLEVGYRFVDVSGNEQEYRTQINDRQGFLLRSLDYTSTARSAGSSTTFTSTPRTSAPVRPGSCASRPARPTSTS